MIDESRDCGDVLDQIAAARAALDSLALEILDDYAARSLTAALGDRDPEAVVATQRQVLEVLRRFGRSR